MPRHGGFCVLEFPEAASLPSFRFLETTLIELAPSILSADFARLGEQVRAAAEGGGSVVHVDIMDGHFVPNISFGPEVVRVLRPLSRMFLDVHLMCSRPEILLDPFAKAGADQMTVHVELRDRVAPLL